MPYQAVKRAYIYIYTHLRAPFDGFEDTAHTEVIPHLFEAPAVEVLGEEGELLGGQHCGEVFRQPPEALAVKFLQTVNRRDDQSFQNTFYAPAHTRLWRGG